MLQKLLNLGLVEIGSDDSRFVKMQAASSALAEHFVENPTLLITATLIALDEEAAEDEPFFDLVEGLVIAEWSTLRNTHTNRPRQLLRSIAVDALAIATADHAERSFVVWSTSVSLRKHAQVRLGRGAALVEELLEQAFERAEGEAVERAGMNALATPRRKTGHQKGLAPGAVKLAFAINASEISQDIAGTAGPNTPQGQAIKGANPVWPNSGQQWANHFAPRMALALAKAVNLGTSRLAQSLKEELVPYLAAHEKRVLDELHEREALEAKRAQASRSSRMRLDLLWWSQARYSPSMKRGYSELADYVAALVAAVDVSAMVPSLPPASVSYVLGESVAASADGREARRGRLGDVLKGLVDIAPDLEEFLRPEKATKGRAPLLELVAEATQGAIIGDDELRSRTGIDPHLELSPADFAMWIFRDLRAQRIVRSVG